MINIKKLVALDMTLNGKWLIFTEFVVGMFGILALAYFLKLGIFWKIWLLGISINYLPLALYAYLFVIRNNYKEVAAEIAEVSKYNRQQFLILIPFLITTISITQLFYKDSSNIVHPGTKA